MTEESKPLLNNDDVTEQKTLDAGNVDQQFAFVTDRYTLILLCIVYSRYMIRFINPLVYYKQSIIAYDDFIK